MRMPAWKGVGVGEMGEHVNVPPIRKIPTLGSNKKTKWQ